MIDEKEIKEVTDFLAYSNKLVRDITEKSSNIEMKFQHLSDTLEINFSIKRREPHTGGLG